MPTYDKKTPGVYIEEVSLFPPSVAAVETAIPAFIGYTKETQDGNDDTLVNIPTRITSLLEYEQIFGLAPVKSLSVNVKQEGTAITVTFNPITGPGLPDYFLYYSMQLFYANGGGPCYVVSVGAYVYPYVAPPTSIEPFTKAIDALERFDEPTLLVFPDAVSFADTSPEEGKFDSMHADIVNAALSHCNTMQDRFTITDVRDAWSGGKIVTNADVTAHFRENVTSELKYGAAYFPYVRTSLPWITDDDHVTIASHTGAPPAETIAVPDPDNPPAISTIKTDYTAVYNAVKQFVSAATVTIPPSGGIAGVYARVDASRGVWKAPANVGLLNVIEPAIKITDGENEGLNVDVTSGKSVNAIRAFTGKGTLVWGARTLAGNDNENRYVPVRRFLIFAEESIKKAVAFFVFEPNDALTWSKVRSMIESFLTRQWRDGALAGAKPEDAFYVAVGLNKTMTAQDILDGYLIVEIGLAIVRPAEFIVLKFSQLMQQS